MFLFLFKRTSHGEVIPQKSPHVIGYGLLSEIEVSVEDPKATFCTKLYPAAEDSNHIHLMRSKAL
jgi:hypothetical protein